MFPDPDLIWRAFPSILDGMKAPPYVLSRGVWRGALNLLVTESAPGASAYGVEIPDCQIYAAYEEMIYSCADHGDRSRVYDGGIYIKEAERSQLLKSFERIDPLGRKPRHFLFVGGDYCYETLGFSAPCARAFPGLEEAYAWARGQDEMASRSKLGEGS